MSLKEHEDAIWKLAREVVWMMAGKEKAITPEMSLDVLALAYMGLVRSNPRLLTAARKQLETVLEVCDQIPMGEPITHPKSPIH